MNIWCNGKPGITGLAILLCIFFLSTSAQTIKVSGRLLDDEGRAIGGDIFLDTLLQKLNFFGGNPTKKQFENRELVHIPVNDDGVFSMLFKGDIPHYIYITSPGKRTTTVFFPQTQNKTVEVNVTLYDDSLTRDESIRNVNTSDTTINKWIDVFAFSNQTGNTDVGRYIEASAKWRLEHKTNEGFRFDLSGYYNKMLALYKDAGDRSLKNYILLNLSFLSFSRIFPVEEKYLREAVVNTPSNDYLWVADPRFIQGVSTGLGGLKRNKDLVMDLVDSLIEYTPLERNKPAIIYSAMVDAYDNELSEFNKYYELLVNNYPKSQPAQNAIKRYGANLKIKEGGVFPQFNIINLDQPGEYITNTILKENKIWLIDFWATWCMPCITQFPNIEKVYTKYRNKGLGVLSISVDKEMETVKNFVKQHYNFPWLNGFMGDQKEIMAKYEVFLLPKTILVDAKGNILSISRSELEDEALEITIKSYL